MKHIYFNDSWNGEETKDNKTYQGRMDKFLKNAYSSTQQKKVQKKRQYIQTFDLINCEMQI